MNFLLAIALTAVVIGIPACWLIRRKRQRFLDRINLVEPTGVDTDSKN